jgi:hypothetical protein
MIYPAAIVQLQKTIVHETVFYVRFLDRSAATVDLT